MLTLPGRGGTSIHDTSRLRGTGKYFAFLDVDDECASVLACGVRSFRHVVFVAFDSRGSYLENGNDTCWHGLPRNEQRMCLSFEYAVPVASV